MKQRSVVLPVILLLSFGCIQATKESVEEYIPKVPENVDSTHLRIVEMQQSSRRVFLNKAGFWETEVGEGHVFIYIPEGEFTMGSSFGLDNERPVRKIYLDGYWMGKYPVTVGQFRRFVDKTDHVTDAEKGMGSWQWSLQEREWIPQNDGSWKNPYFEQGQDHPVVSVSWNDGVAYCEWLTKKLSLEFKLATAAQFEKGARGIDGRRYPWGNEKPDGTRSNYADINFWQKYGDARQPDRSVDDGFTETSPVGSFPAGASPYGLMDMAGNVWEWNHDVYDPDYTSYMPDRNPSGPTDTSKADEGRENRGGGSWTDRSGYLTPEGGHNLRSAARTGDEQNSSDDHMGFRIAIDFFGRK